MVRIITIVMVLSLGFMVFHGMVAAANSQERVPEQYTALLGDAGDLMLPDVDLGETERLTVLNIIFFITGGLATIFILIGALRYVLAAGNPDRIQQAKNTIMYAIVGLLITVFAIAIVNFVIMSL